MEVLPVNSACNGDDIWHGETPSNQLVLYEDELVVDPTQYEVPSDTIYSEPDTRVLPSVGAFTAQCNNCMKWRLIPSKGIYEEIREKISEEPFFCETARRWKPDVSCDDPPDILQDDSKLWAIDKPNIAQPPPGWERLLRIRGEGSTRFADVYYVAPSGKRLRSKVEVQKYLCEHPEYIYEGVRMSQFSFKIPSPLQENYVRKTKSSGGSGSGGEGIAMPTEFGEANPLSMIGYADASDLRIGEPDLPTLFNKRVAVPTSPPVLPSVKKTKKKKSALPSLEHENHGLMSNSTAINLESSCRLPPTKKKRKSRKLELEQQYLGLLQLATDFEMENATNSTQSVMPIYTLPLVPKEEEEEEMKASKKRMDDNHHSPVNTASIMKHEDFSLYTPVPKEKMKASKKRMDDNHHSPVNIASIMKHEDFSLYTPVPKEEKMKAIKKRMEDENHTPLNPAYFVKLEDFPRSTNASPYGL